MRIVILDWTYSNIIILEEKAIEEPHNSIDG